MSARARLPALDWAHDEAAGRHRGLDWVDATVEVHRDAYRTVEDGEVRFQHFPYAAFFPPAMLEAVAAAQARGIATVPEALLLLVARVEWQLQSRPWWWTALTPAPPLLVALVEAYGVERAVHRHQPEVLARLVALLPTWFRTRGTVAAATKLLDAATLAEVAPAVAEDRELENELFACRPASWWRDRATPAPQGTLRVTAGIVLFQDRSPAFGRRQEDTLVRWSPGTSLSPTFLRLLPPWTMLRPVLESP